MMTQKKPSLTNLAYFPAPDKIAVPGVVLVNGNTLAEAELTVKLAFCLITSSLPEMPGEGKVIT